IPVDAARGAVFLVRAGDNRMTVPAHRDSAAELVTRIVVGALDVRARRPFAASWRSRGAAREDIERARFLRLVFVLPPCIENFLDEELLDHRRVNTARCAVLEI